MEAARSWSRRRDLGRIVAFMGEGDGTRVAGLRAQRSLTQPGGHGSDTPSSRAALPNGYGVLRDGKSSEMYLGKKGRVPPCRLTMLVLSSSSVMSTESLCLVDLQPVSSSKGPSQGFR